MKYWMVGQNRSFEEEMVGGYLWAPQETNRSNPAWTDMKKLNVGDRVFSYYKREIRAVSVVLAEVTLKKVTTPKNARDLAALWDRPGYYAPAIYVVLTIRSLSMIFRKRRSSS